MICDTKLTEPKIEPEDADCEDPKKEVCVNLMKD